MHKRPLDPHLRVGAVQIVEATAISVSVKRENASMPLTGYGEESLPITYGTYIAFPCPDSSILLGRVSEVQGPILNSPNIIIKCQILCSYSTIKSEAERGILCHPVVGSDAFVVTPDLIPLFLGESKGRSISIGTINAAKNPLKVSMKDIFARHCAIVGNTGSGKSWSLASIIEKTTSHDVRVILLDATGEFVDLPQSIASHVDLGSQQSAPHSNLVSFTYRNLTVEDMFAFFKPSPQAQAPILKEAIKTLKLIEGGFLQGNANANRNFKKDNASRSAYEAGYARGHAKATSSSCDFSLDDLVEQIKYECINIDTWATDTRQIGYQQTLILRIENWKNTAELKCLWDTNLPSLTDEVNTFLTGTKKVLRISLKHLSFEFSTREIVVNAFCRYLMRKARAGEFNSNPLIFAVDEAHNFFRPSVKFGDDEVTSESLDIIAKEGRKYGLMLLLATQRPKDIPQGVMSQIGTVICHRITNMSDAEILKGTVGEFNRHIISALPTLTQGEAFVTTPNFTFPVSLIVEKPSFEPKSRDPI
ncbi:ATP-binding protein [Bdellovibrio sp. HCB290]|uniref:ATP-binding protein n=1 Tax=Bdellovibrio sp. HCB290 TaxID=3394356 RepID=UPI0039B3DBA9